MDKLKLVEAARNAAQYARAEYSGYRVGAALLTENGAVFTGCNIESSSYGLTVCAERVALVKALSEGADHITMLAVATFGEKPAPPCGACRQLLYDYAPDLQIVLAGNSGEFEIVTLQELFPRPFGKNQLDNNK